MYASSGLPPPAGVNRMVAPPMAAVLYGAAVAFAVELVPQRLLPLTTNTDPGAMPALYPPASSTAVMVGACPKSTPLINARGAARNIFFINNPPSFGAESHARPAEGRYCKRKTFVCSDTCRFTVGSSRRRLPGLAR